LCALLLIVTIAVLAIEASKTSVLDVDHIEVTGSVEVPAEAALVASGVQKGDPIFGVDTGAVRSRLEAIPWVRTAKVSRHYPNRLRIALEERSPVAFSARPEGGFALLDAAARVLADRPDRPAGLPEVAGAGAPPGAGAFLATATPALDALAALPPELRAQVSQFTVAEGNLTLVLGGREVRLGASDQLAGKAASLAALLAKLGAVPLYRYRLKKSDG
jgi:cell division protein FtsQ